MSVVKGVRIEIIAKENDSPRIMREIVIFSAPLIGKYFLYKLFFWLVNEDQKITNFKKNLNHTKHTPKGNTKSLKKRCFKLEMEKIIKKMSFEIKRVINFLAHLNKKNSQVEHG